MLKKDQKLLVLGIGNFLCGDDGIGSVLADELARELNKPDVDIIDGGTIGLGLLYLLENYTDLMLIDSVDLGEDPGEIYKFNEEDLDALHPESKISFHQSGLLELLKHGRLMGNLPEKVTILGVQIKKVSFEIGLSPELQEKFPVIKGRITEEIRSYFSNA